MSINKPEADNAEHNRCTCKQNCKFKLFYDAESERRQAIIVVGVGSGGLSKVKCLRNRRDSWWLASFFSAHPIPRNRFSCTPIPDSDRPSSLAIRWVSEAPTVNLQQPEFKLQIWKKESSKQILLKGLRGLISRAHFYQRFCTRRWAANQFKTIASNGMNAIDSGVLRGCVFENNPLLTANRGL